MGTFLGDLELGFLELKNYFWMQFYLKINAVMQLLRIPL